MKEIIISIISLFNSFLADKKAFMTNVNAIQADNTKSTEYKATLCKKAKDEFIVKADDYRNQMETLFQQLKEAEDNLSKDLSFIKDETFINTVKLIELCGDSIEYKFIEQLTDKMKHNPAALKTLKTIYIKHHIVDPDSERYINDFKFINSDYLSDRLYYGFKMLNANMTEVAQAIENYINQYNFTGTEAQINQNLLIELRSLILPSNI